MATLMSVATAIMWLAIGTAIGLAYPRMATRWRRSLAESPRGSAQPGGCTNENGIPAGKSHQGVTIRACVGSCAVATAQQGHRYLAGKAPQLPLPGCDARNCSCRYERHVDRRAKRERRSERHGQLGNIDSRPDRAERRVADDDDRRGAPEFETQAYFNDY